MKFPFRHSLADGARTDGYDSDSIRLYDSESEDDEHYLWQPPPDKRRHTTEKFYKVGPSAFQSKSLFQIEVTLISGVGYVALVITAHVHQDESFRTCVLG